MASAWTVGVMTRQEAAWTVDLAAREGWNPGLHDAACFYATDPGGFLVGRLDGRPVGCISAIAYDEAFGFMGFYIVLPEFRGRGYGLKLWQAAVDRLGDRNIGLDGVIEQQENYSKSGFHLAYLNIRFERLALQEAPDDNSGLVPLRDVPLDAVAAYDRLCFPACRNLFLRHWLILPDSKGVAAMENGRIAGYGVIRRCREGCKIGPLFADDPLRAEAIYRRLSLFARPEEMVYLDCPEVNDDAVALALRYNMRMVFGTVRMYSRSEPPISLNRVFGVTSFELG